jgi:hypothetical protein
VNAESDHWVDVLNLDPRHRAAAGLGAEVIRKQQEGLMKSAWEQIGDIENANDILKRAQFGRESSNYLHDRFGSMHAEDFLRTTAPAQKRILQDCGDEGKKTVSTKLHENTRIPKAALDPAFRRIACARGPIRKRQRRPDKDPKMEIRPMDMLRRIASGEIAPAGRHVTPEGTFTLCDITIRMFQEFVFGGEGSVDEGVSDPVGGVSSPGGGGSDPDPDESSPRSVLSDIMITPEQIQPPINAMRFCDSRITSIQIARGTSDDESLKDAVSDTIDNFLRPSEGAEKEPDSIDLDSIRSIIHDALDPRTTIKERVKKRLRLNGSIASHLEKEAPEDPLDPIWAYPVFPQPMYEPLRDLSETHILPGVEKIPQNTVSLLRTNGRFFEGYMVGLNHEFASELLWRGYPTDQRGSYFRQFWDVSEYVGKDSPDPKISELTDKGELKEEKRETLKDIPFIDKWEAPLGENNRWNSKKKRQGESSSPEENQDDNFVVLVVRGDLLNRYPNAVIYAVEARTDDKTMPDLIEFDDKRNPSNGIASKNLRTVSSPTYPIFRGSLGADLVFLGFPFAKEDARSSDTNPGKFFVFEERISEARFGLDKESEPGNINWDNLSWADFRLADSEDKYFDKDDDCMGEYLDAAQCVLADSEKMWNENTSSAGRALITLQKPARLVVHADQMIPEE